MAGSYRFHAWTEILILKPAEFGTIMVPNSAAFNMQSGPLLWWSWHWSLIVNFIVSFPVIEALGIKVHLFLLLPYYRVKSWSWNCEVAIKNCMTLGIMSLLLSALFFIITLDQYMNDFEICYNLDSSTKFDAERGSKLFCSLLSIHAHEILWWCLFNFCCSYHLSFILIHGNCPSASILNVLVMLGSN